MQHVRLDATRPPRRAQRALRAPPARSLPRLQRDVALGARALLAMVQWHRDPPLLIGSVAPALRVSAGLASTTAALAQLYCCVNKMSGNPASLRFRRIASAQHTWRSVPKVSTHSWHQLLHLIASAGASCRAILWRNMRPRRPGLRGTGSVILVRRDKSVMALHSSHLAQPGAMRRRVRARAPIARPGGTRRRAAHHARRATPGTLRHL